jgi:hypothetical protein
MMHILSLLLVANSAAAYDGRGLLNRIVVGTDYEISEVTEIRSFAAVFNESESGERLIHFSLYLDADAAEQLDAMLILRREGELIARVDLVAVPGLEGEKIIGWQTSSELDGNSHAVFWLHFDTDEQTLVELAFDQATCVFLDRERKQTRMSYDELRKAVATANVR